MSIRKLLIFVCLLGALSFDAFAQSAADKLIGYKWQPIRLSSYTAGTAPEVDANLNAFATLVRAEKAEGKGKYLQDIINGFWFYASAYTWSKPEETGGKLPAFEGQEQTPTTAMTAGLILNAWAAFSPQFNDQLPVLGQRLSATMKRLCGKELK